jgi:hypothetical protein
MCLLLEVKKVTGNELPEAVEVFDFDNKCANMDDHVVVLMRLSR